MTGRNRRAELPVARALVRRCARRFVVGVEGPELEAGEAEILAEFPPAGVILFKRNLVSPRQTRRLVGALRGAVDRPIFVAIDQEGGRVDRLAAFRAPSPSAEELAAGGLRACERAGRATARALRRLDIDVDFAPVVDLRPDRAEAVGFAGRAFGDRPDVVVELAGAFGAGLAAGGVTPCLKHFPGLGKGSVDSHRSLPVVRASRETLLREDIRPFADLAAVIPSVMVAHASYPSLDPTGRPASLSARIVRGLLFRKIGFDGAVFSDDLEMGALSEYGNLPERATAAFRAGATFLLICREISEYPEAALAVAADASRRAGRGLLAGAELRDRRFRLDCLGPGAGLRRVAGQACRTASRGASNRRVDERRSSASVGSGST